MLICNNCDKIYLKYENKCSYCDFDNSQESNLNQDSNFFEKKDSLYILHDPFKEETITKHTKKIFIRNWDTVESLKKNINTSGWGVIEYDFDGPDYDDSWGYNVIKYLIGSTKEEAQYIWAKYCFHIVVQNLKSPKENIFKLKFLHQRGYNSDDVRINDIIILADNEKIKINKVYNPYSVKEIKDNKLEYESNEGDLNYDSYYADYYINDENSCDISADETLKICKAKNIEVRLYFSNNITVNLSDKEETQLQWHLIDIYKKSIEPSEKFYLEEEAKRLKELEEKEKIRKAEAERAQKELEEKNRIEKAEANRVQRELDKPKREKRNKFLFLFVIIGVVACFLYINQDTIKEKIEFGLLSNQVENKQTKSNITKEKNNENLKVVEDKKEKPIPFKSMQQNLKTLGYYDGEIDGIFGKQSVKALNRWQLDNDENITLQPNLEHYEMIDTQTINKLFENNTKKNVPIKKEVAPMTISEMDLLTQQLQSCLNLNTDVDLMNKIKPVIFVEVNPDRTVKTAIIFNKDKSNDTSFRIASESALRAFNNQRCSTLRLPVHKFDYWKKLYFTYDFRYVAFNVI